MKRTAKILGSSTVMLAAAAFAGLISGTASSSMASTNNASAKTTIGSTAGVRSHAIQADAHDCAGKNSCKGQGGCKTSDQGCKGKNSCKGKGGCKVGSTTAPSLL
jgi:hypothetical protein